MTTDFHTHAFPAGIAQKALTELSGGILLNSGTVVFPSTDGSYQGLVSEAEANGIGRSVVLPVATRPGQADGINRHAREAERASGGRIVCFAAAHPADPEPERTCVRLAEEGFRGIKLHPEFQREFFDGDATLRLLRAARDAGLCVVTHAGADIGLPPPVHCEPERIARVIERVPGLTLVAAHLGGWMMWDRVASFLCGLPLYFDTAFLSGYADPGTVRDVISAHGAEKVLFGSDSPWESPGRTLALLRSAGLGAEEEKAILSENAEKILRRQK